MSALAHHRADVPDLPGPPDLEDVRLVADEVWRSLLGESEELLVPSGDPVASPTPEGVWSAAVTVAGAWHGTVTVELASGVAADLTRRMLDLAGTTPPDHADVADAVGELANMIGGNLKSLLPGPSTLSLPSVAAHRAGRPEESTELLRLDARWRGHPVRVQVHRSGPAADPTSPTSPTEECR